MDLMRCPGVATPELSLKARSHAWRVALSATDLVLSREFSRARIVIEHDENNIGA